MSQSMISTDKHHYDVEFNEDGTEKHVICDGARYHVLSWVGRMDVFGKFTSEPHCSVPNCEINKRHNHVW